MITETIAGPGGIPFLIPGSPENTRDHALWICDQVFAGEYDHPELPTDVKTAVDIGSHVGAFAAWAAVRWPSLELVYAYDPNDLACELAMANAVRAGCKSISVRPLAVTEQPTARYGLPWDWGSAKTHGLGPDEGEPCQVIHPRDLPAADVLKCDSEGTEIEVLNHYAHWDQLKAVLVEFHCPDHRIAQRKIATARGFRCLKEEDREYGVALWVRA